MASIRDYSRPTIVALIAAGLIIASTAQRSWSQRGDPSEELLKMFPKVTDAFKAVKSRGEPVAGDDAHQALLRLRLGAAARYAEAEFRFVGFGVRGYQPQQLYSAVQSMGEAELALLDNPADRIAAHDRLVDVARAVESVYKARVEAGTVAEQDFLSARQFCATCELAAMDARHNPPKPAPKQSYPPPSSDFAPDTIERTIEQGMAAIRQLPSDELSVAPGLADNERKKPLIEQRATLLLALAYRLQMMESGAPNSGVDRLFASDFLPSLSKIELALDDRPSNQLRIAERDLVLAKMLEAIAQTRQGTGGIPWYRPRCDRLSAELKLMELRQAFPGVAAAKPRKIESKPGAPKTAAESDPLALTEAERAELGKLVVFTDQGILINPELIIPIRSIVSAELAPGDDEWRKLAKSRHAWAKLELQLRLRAYCGGRPTQTANDLVGAFQRFEVSALALTKDSTERKATIECASKLFRVVVLFDRQRVSTGALSPFDVWISQVARLDTQIRLLDERRK